MSRPAIVLIAAAMVAGAIAIWLGSAHALGGQDDAFADGVLPDGTSAHALGGQDDAFADGVLPDGTSAYDDVPGITRLDPRLREAVQRATDDAKAEGIDVIVNSGWRSERLQEELLADAIDDYGSRTEAERWVAAPQASAHVTGDAVDIGSWDAAEWMQRNGARYDLCQTYMNEGWHFELREGAAQDGCPAPSLDASEGTSGAAAVSR